MLGRGGGTAMRIFNPTDILPITTLLQSTYRVQITSLNIWHGQMMQGCKKCAVGIACICVAYAQCTVRYVW